MQGGTEARNSRCMRGKMDATTAETRTAARRRRISAGRLRRSAPERPSPTRRSRSWSAASAPRGTSPVPNGPTWQEPWSSQRPRWKSGSRTGDIKLNGGRWRLIWWRWAHRRLWLSRCWWGTSQRIKEGSTSPRLDLCTRTLSTTPTCAISPAAETCSDETFFLLHVCFTGNFVQHLRCCLNNTI